MQDGSVRTVSAAEAVAGITSGDNVFIGSGAAEPDSLVAAMTARAPELRGVKIFHIYTLGAAGYCAPGLEESFRHIAFFVGANVRQAVADGRADVIPIHLHQIPSLFQQRYPPDWALVQLSPPDKHGYCSVGVSAEVVVTAIRSAKHVVAEINPQMPRTWGSTQVHVRHLDAIVEVDVPLPEVAPLDVTPVTAAIGRNVASLIRDGDCLQAGIGGIPNAVLGELLGHRHLGIHTEALTDGVVDLVEAGAVDNSRKQVRPGKSLCGFVLGTRRLYDFVDDNPSVSLRSADMVNDPRVIATNDNVVAINSALEIDLTGQVNADSIGPSVYSGFGGQVDFIRGAARSVGGRPVIALPSTAKGGSISRIVPTLRPGAGVVTTRADVHYVVTEHGIADLFGRPLHERIASLIEIADPAHREQLEADARSLGVLR